METKGEKAFKDGEESILPVHIKNSSHMRTEKRPLDFSSLEVTNHLRKSQGKGSCKESKTKGRGESVSQMRVDRVRSEN